MKIKSIIILLLVCVAAQSVSAQRRLKYKDVFDDMPNVKPEISYMRYDELRQQDPEFTNTYFQMGLLDWAWLQEEDPFVNTQRVNQLIYDTKLYLGVCAGYLKRDDKEVKKNKVYYSNYRIIPDMEQLDYQDVVNYVNKTIDKVKEYETNVTKILGFYTKTVEKNNNCVEIFKNILATQSNYKNLLMSADKDIKKQLIELRQNFDSVNYYFNEYKTALANYPIKQYNQQLEIIPISTYRLDGLTSSDFLQPKVPVWDYRTWVNEVNGIMDGNIADVKTQSIVYVNDIRRTLSGYEKSKQPTDAIAEFKPNNKLVNLTEKYDYKSLMSACVNYETALANLKLVTMKTSNQPADPAAAAEPYSSKVLFYYDLYQHKEKCDGILEMIKSRNNKRTCEKHKIFIDSIYTSTNEFFSNFDNSQRQTLNTIEKEYLANLTQFASNEFNPQNVQAQWQKANIPLAVYTGTFEEAQAGNYYTLYNTRDAFGNRYSCGFRKTTSTAATGFVAKTDIEGKVLWLRNITNSPAGQNFVVSVIPGDGGIYVTTTVTSDNSGNKTQAAKYDETGKQVAKVDFSSPLIPVASAYDDVNEQVTAVFKGTKLNAANGAEDAEVATADFAAKAATKKGSLSIDGNISGVMLASGKIVAVCNYKAIKSDEHKIDIKSAGDIAIITIDEAITASPMNSKVPVYSIYPAKVNAQTICIPAVKGDAKTTLQPTDQIIYNIADINGKFAYSSAK
ncbi:MAG: hypothetical protein J5882_07380 [Bacteroidales bacterium]|nr:hypothetical protein [Bacteroidales bacterium]